MIKNYTDFQVYTSKNDAVLAYFSHDECNVCKVLKPKIIQLLESNFPKINFVYINIKETPEISSQQSVFTVPTIISYFGGKEFFRKSRSIGIEELRNELDRPYNLLFS
jgi:thioredoxin